MTKLIKKTDSRYFEQTSNDPYIRHHYKIVNTNGDSVVVDNWQDVSVLWFQKNAFLSHVEILN